MNKHLYKVSDQFQKWWMEQCNAPFEPLMEKLMSWKAWEKQQEKIKQLEDLLKTTTCKKGCGEVVIELHCGDPICSNCGEELHDQITHGHFQWIKETLQNDR